MRRAYLQPHYCVRVCTHVRMCVRSLFRLVEKSVRPERVGRDHTLRVQSEAGRDPLVLEECRRGGLMVSLRWRN